MTKEEALCLEVDTLYEFHMKDGKVLRKRGSWLMDYSPDGSRKVSKFKLNRIDKYFKV